MNKNKVLIFGGGHLAYRVKKLAESAEYNIIHMPVVTHFQGQGPVFDDLQDLFKGIELSEFAMVYLLDEREDYNLGLALALMTVDEHVPITIALFNENIAPHLQATHSNVHVINPAKIAAPHFVASLNEELSRFLRYEPLKQLSTLKTKGVDGLYLLIGIFLLIITGSVGYFCTVGGMPFSTALYFVLASVVNIVGFGDIVNMPVNPVSKMIFMALVFCSVAFVWLIFSFTMDRIIQTRAQYSLGRKKYKYRDHVIVCGLGRLGFFIVEELIQKGEQIIVIESNEKSSNIEHFKNKGIAVYVGNARSPQVLEDVGVVHAKALISVISDDYINLEIGLNARSFQADIRLILRIFDDVMAQNIKEHLDIQLAFSVSAIASEKVFGVLKSKE